MSQVVCNYNAHVAIVVSQTPKKTVYLELTPAGPVISDMLTSSFTKEYYRMSPYSAKDAALRFLKASIRAFSFNEKAIEKLKEIVMSHEDVTVEEQAVVDQASEPTDAQNATADKKAKRAEKARAARPKKDPSEYKPRGRGIGAFIREQLKAGTETAAILEQVKAQWPDAKTTAASIAWYRNDLKKAA